MIGDHDHATPSFSAGRRWGAGLNLCLGIAALLAILVMANYLAARHYRRHALSEDRVPPLSPVTVQVLKALTNEVRATIFFDPDEALYTHILALLREYQAANPKVKVEAVNYLTEPARAEQIKSAYKLAPTVKDVVIFDCASRHKLIRQNELSEFDASKLLAGQGDSVRRKSFTGESLFTSALLTVLEPRKARVYFLSGHGEHDPRNLTADTGYGKFARRLQEQHEVSLITLFGTNDIPADCQLLILAGPATPLDGTEQEKLNRHLQMGGRLLLLLRSGAVTGLDPLLELWGVAVGDDLVVDRESSKSDSVVVVGQFASHEIVRPLGQAGLPLALVQPRSISRRAGPQASDAPQAVELATTTAAGVAVSDYRTGLREHPTRDRRGAIPLAVAVERGGLTGVDRGSTRMVVVGDSHFLDNQMLDIAGNPDFAWNLTNWLLDRSMLLNIGPRQLKDRTFLMTDRQARTLQWILLGAVPGAVLALGLLVWFRRQH